MRRNAPAIAICAVLIAQPLLLSQTAIKLPKNKYTPAQDAQLGLKAAAEVRKQYPVIKDGPIAEYLKTLGDRLVAQAPKELNHKEFQYSFTPVNVKEINAFALPGGPMFVNRGMFDAAKTEGEVVGVMAHELSHVLLRHGTANVTKAENPWLQLGKLAGAVGGSMVGGGLGTAIAQGTDFGLGTLMLRYSRDFEKQADILGSQIMARAGYDPRDLGRMFETIEKASGGGGGNPQWMNSHPNPGNRTKYISEEAALLTVAARADSSQFEPMKQRFTAQPAAASMADVERGATAQPAASEATPSVGTPGKPVAPPSTNFKELSGGNVFKASVPENWTNLASKTSIRVVPENGFGDVNGQSMFTHGIEFGVTRASSRDLVQATQAFLQGIAQNNPQLKVAGQQQMTKISERSALYVPMENASPLGGVEKVSMTTVFLAEGTLFYYLTVVQDKDASTFEPVFRKIAQSIKLTEVR